MDKLQWSVETRKVADLKVYDKNPRTITDTAFAKLKERIVNRGMHDVLKIDLDNTVLSGNQRLQALKDLNIETVNVILPNRALTDDEKQKVVLESNRNDGAWDFEMLANEFDMDLLKEVGFSPLELGKDVFNKEVKDDEVPEAGKGAATSKSGQIWQLGRHRIMCSDSTEIEAVTNLMNGKRADITFHSPPYNVGRTPNGNDKKYLNDTDSKDDADYVDLLVNTTVNALAYSDYAFVNLQSVAGNKIALIDYLYLLKESFADYIIWDKTKGEPAMAENVLNSRFEFVYVFSKEAKRTIGKAPFRGTIDNVITMSSNKDKEFSKIHKATFPVDFAAFFCQSFARETVLDLFGGVGTTLIAAEQIGMTAYLMEIDPHYVDIIIQRWEKLTGEKAKLLSD